MLYSSYYTSPLGDILLVSDGEALTHLLLKGQKYYINDNIVKNLIIQELTLFKDVKVWLNAYFNGKNPNSSNLKLKPSGSDFRQQVWQILMQIPYGKTITYGDIAREISNNNKTKMSSQAVGGAVGHNPISIIIPCHRVMGAKGNLTGFASGINNKIQLLKLEEVDLSNMFIPNKGTAL